SKEIVSGMRRFVPRTFVNLLPGISVLLSAVHAGDHTFLVKWYTSVHLKDVRTRCAQRVGKKERLRCNQLAFAARVPAQRPLQPEATVTLRSLVSSLTTLLLT